MIKLKKTVNVHLTQLAGTMHNILLGWASTLKYPTYLPWISSYF